MVSNVVKGNHGGMSIPNNKVFIKNLNNTTTDEDLINFFETLAPLKKCYVVKGQDGLCRGYGYAQFVFEEDAKSLIEVLDRTMLNGQVIHIEHYKARDCRSDSKSETEKDRNFVKNKEKDRSSDSKNKIGKNCSDFKNTIEKDHSSYPKDKIEKDHSFDPKNNGGDCRLFKNKAEKYRCSDSKDKTGKDHQSDFKNTQLSKAPKSKDTFNAMPEHSTAKNTPKYLHQTAIVHSQSQAKKSYEGEMMHTDSKDPSRVKINVKWPNIATRTLVLSKLPEYLTFDQIFKRVKKVSDFQALEFPSSPQTAYLLFPSAEKAVLSLLEIQNENSLFDDFDATSDARLYSTTYIKQYTVIVRNLPYECTKGHLAEAFEVFGKIFEVSLPVDQHSKRCKGFGFVTFLDSLSVDKAVAGSAQLFILNRKVEVNRTVKRHKLKEIKSPAVHDVNTKTEDDDGSESIHNDGDGGEVDEHGEGDEIDNDDNEYSEDDDDGYISDGKEDTDSGDFEDECSQSVDEDDEAVESIDDNCVDSSTFDNKDLTVQKRDSKKTSSGFLGDACLGRTLFLRNIAFETTEEEMYRKFSKWGPLAYVKFVKHRETGEFTGSGFVQFVHAQDAEKCVDDAYLSAKFIDKSLMLRQKLQKRGTMTEKESDIVINGRHLIVNMAVSREDSTLFDRPKHALNDSRNLSLAKYSVLSSDEVNALTREELVKYEHSQHDKKTKLSNPNFHVSRTRLCVRNLPKSLDEKKLKLIFLKAVTLPSLPAPRLHQVKIVRNQLEGNKSRGYGFVEFKDHVHSKAALLALHNKSCREANDNRLFVEFAIENMKLLFKRKLRLTKRPGRETKLAAPSDVSDNTPGFGTEGKADELPSRRRKRERVVDGKDDDFENNRAAHNNKRARTTKQPRPFRTSASAFSKRSVKSKASASNHRGKRAGTNSKRPRQSFKKKYQSRKPTSVKKRSRATQRR